MFNFNHPNTGIKYFMYSNCKGRRGTCGDNVTRHTFATICRKQGVDPLVTKELLGHSPAADVTEKVYTHIDEEMLNFAVSQIKK